MHMYARMYLHMHIFSYEHTEICVWINIYFGGACGVMVIVVGNGHGDTSSNPERDWLHFT